LFQIPTLPPRKKAAQQPPNTFPRYRCNVISVVIIDVIVVVVVVL
jgi:hypothetical protein